MRFSSSAVMAVVVSMMMMKMEQGTAFVLPQGPLGAQQQHRTLRSRHYMAMDIPPAASAVNLPVIQANQYGPSDVRYSDFLKLVTADRIEKVTFSADGSQLLGVDVDGARVKIESLPNDPDLLTQLTSHKVSSLNFLERLNYSFCSPRHCWLWNRLRFHVIHVPIFFCPLPSPPRSM
jgi:hypothetical protein